MTCFACKKDGLCVLHYYIRRNNLHKHEYGDARYRIPLCFKCHFGVHFSPNCSGLMFYEEYGITEQLTERCGGDVRWTRWIEKQKARIEIKGLTNSENKNIL